MMKIAYKEYFLGVLSLVLILAFLVPSSVSAVTAEEMRMKRDENRAAMQKMHADKMTERKEERGVKMEERKSERQEKFCETFVSHAEKITGNVSERRGKIEDRKEHRVRSLQEHRDKRGEDREGNRSDADTHRVAMYAKLEGRADTDTKKAAVAKFKDSVEDAVDVRRRAVDTAIATFRSGVDVAIASRKDDVLGVADDFKNAVDTAIAKAKSDCASGTDPETVRRNFKSALQVARESLASERQSADKVGEQVKALAETRRVAVKKAVADFKATVSVARVDLKQAFGESAVTP